MDVSYATFNELSDAIQPLKDEDSGGKLHVTILNLISLGEWEAASCILRELSGRQDTFLEAKQLLRALTVAANDYWRYSISVPSPSHLSWLSLQLFVELFPDMKNEIPDTVEALTQFMLVLFMTRSITDHTPELEEWLCDYFKSHVITMATRPASPPHSFPSSIQAFLRSLLQEDSCLGHTILQFLTVTEDPNYLHNNETLQMMYIECIDIALSRIEGRVNSTNTPQDRQSTMNKHVQQIFNFLSLIDPIPDMTRVMKAIDRVFLKLIQFRHYDDEGALFTPETIYSCIIGRSSPILVRRFQDIEEFHRSSKDNNEGAEPIVSDNDSKQYWKHEFYLSMKEKQHFLERTMDSGLKFISSLQLDNLSSLMSDPLLRPLKPLLLLMGWDRNPDIGKGRHLLDILWPQISDAQPLLYNGCCKLAFQVGLVQWCLEKARPFIPSGPVAPMYQTTAGDVFQGLKSHSVLYVLHHSAPLHCLDPFEVIDILKLQPESSLPASRRPSPSPGQSNSALSPPPVGREGMSTLTLEQRRDITTFRSFCALKLIMEGIWSSVLITNGLFVKTESGKESQAEELERKKSKAVRKLNYGDSKELPVVEEDPLAATTCTSSSFSQDLYATEVSKKLEQAKTHLSEIFPLHFRLEVMENIFSLLFLSSEDLSKTEPSLSAVVTDSITSSTSRSSDTENDAVSNVHSLNTFIRKHRGFLMNEMLALDILTLLSDAIFELTATKFALLNSPSTSKRDSAHSSSSGPSSVGTSSASSTGSVIVSSVHPGILQQRIAKLQKYINEAKWRLQLVSSKSGLSADLNQSGEVGVSSDEESLSDISDSEETRPLDQDEDVHHHKGKVAQSLDSSKGSSPVSIRSRPSSRGTIKTPSSIAEGSGKDQKILSTTTNDDDSSGHCADVEDRSPLQKSKDSKRHRKKSSTRLNTSSRSRKSTPLQKGSGIICQMLASPDSLLCKCLKHSNYNRAREVLKMFNMDGELGDQLVQFAEQFEKVGIELQGNSRGGRGVSSRPSPVSLTPGGSEVMAAPVPYSTIPKDLDEVNVSLSMVQAAVLAAQTSSPNIDPLHHLLAPANIQDIVFAGNPNLAKSSLDLPLISILLDNTPSLIMLDILATYHIQGQTAKNIINKSVNRSKDALEGLSPKIRDSHPGGRRSYQERKPGVGLDKPLMSPLGLLHLLSEVSGYFVLESPLTTIDQATPTSTIASPHSLLTQFIFPLQISAIQQWKEFSDAYWEARDQLQGMVDESSTSSTDVLDLLLNSPMSRDQLKLRNIFNGVSQSMKLFPTWKSDDQPAPSKGGQVSRGKHYRYLYNVGGYLMKFIQILMKTLGVITISTPNQVLGIIRESPTDLIGRLLFEKEISPDKLEKLVSDLPHLKIVEVIVKCCCPKIPSVCPPGRSARRSVITASHSPFTELHLSSVYPLNISILNEDTRTDGGGGSPDDTRITDPWELSHRLLHKLIVTLKGVSTFDNGHVTVNDLLKAGQTTEMRKVLDRTSQLSSISLSSLADNTNRQIAFFCNVTNLLYAHALMKFLQEEGTEEGRRMMGGTRLTANVLQSDKIAMVTFYTKVGYYIGELGLVSLYDLHYCILRHGLTPCVLDGARHVNLRPPELLHGPWVDYIPVKTDPRVLYIISNGTRSSPMPRTVTPENLQSEMSNAEKRYIQSIVSVDTTRNIVKVPKLLSDHRDDFIPRKSHFDQENAYRELSNSAFVNYIVSKLSDDLAKQCTSIIEASDRANKRGFTLQIADNDLTFGYSFPSSRQSMIDDGVTHLPLKSTPTRRYERLKSYNFTKDTVGFVRQQVPLLASLVCLLCPPESLSNVLEYTSSSEVIEQKQQDSTKQTLGHTIGGHNVHVPAPVFKENKQRLLSIPDESSVVLTSPSPVWQETFDKLSSLFDDGTPLKNFLISRLVCFKGILPWDRLIQEPLRDDDTVNGAEDPAINLRTLPVLPGKSPELEHACVFVLRKLLRNGLVNESLKFLSTEPVVNNREHVKSIGDLVLSACFVNKANDKNQSSKPDGEISPMTVNPVVLIYQLSDIELACRLVLSYIEVWPSDICVQMLKLIHYRLPSSSAYVSIIDEYLYRLNIYQQIVETVEAPNPITLEASISPWTHWSQLVYDSKERADYVLSNLMKNKAFGLAREWAREHGHKDDITEKIEEEYIHDLLEGSEDESDPYTSQGVLEDLPSNVMKLRVCEGLLSRCHKLESLMLILQFILGHLSYNLPSSEQVVRYANDLLGVKALLTLPHFIREQYRPLIHEPLLIIEQLLIDLKTDWITRVLKVISKDEYASYLDTKDTPTLEPRPSALSEDNTDPFLPLIMFYAEKSLAIPSVSVSSTPASSRGHSPSTSSTPFRTREKIRSPTVPPTPRRKSFSSNLGSETANRYVRFEPPAVPPLKEKWEPDSKANYCRVCTTTYFGMFNRRHHCRRCGRVVCKQCSNYSMHVEGYIGNQKVCRDCYNYNMLMSGSTEEDLDTDEPTYTDRTLYPDATNPSYPYQLIPGDSLFNQNLRLEFIYDSSPSISLCLSIVDLISNTRIGARFLLHCCHSVSLQLVPDDHGRVNEEIDHYFTIGMMENLLVNAKLRFTQAGDISGVELCDTYISRVDLLRLLVSSQFTEIPSIQELTRPELAKRVRDRLISDDRYKLAMEVSTKCQLDASPVWSAWGMACIRVGDFPKARELLKHCFQVSSSISSSASNASYLLERVIDQITSCPLSSVTHKDEWGENIKATNQLTDHRHEVALMDTIRFKECCHYVHTYGTHSTIVAFYSKHQCWKDACLYILRNNCSTDVFVDNLWVVAIKAGRLEYLEEVVRVIDPTLSKWEPYMNGVCRLLSQRRLYQILYRTQLFMKDFVRAAMTCIKFFIGSSKRSTTIVELYERKKFLETAKQHFEASLESPQNRNVFKRSSEDQSQGTLPKNMTSQELQMHIHTVQMQLKITEILYLSAKEFKSLDKPLPVVGGGRRDGQEQPATLFSSGVVRGEVICNLLSSCIDVSQAFQVAFEAISAYRLPVNRVFVEATRQLAIKERYSDIRHLLQILQKSPLASKQLNDDVCVSAIKVLATQSKEVQGSKQLERLIEAIYDERNKIKALVQCGKLKNAYLVAINAKLPDEVRKIADVASKAGQLGVRDICEKWLQHNKRK